MNIENTPQLITVFGLLLLFVLAGASSLLDKPLHRLPIPLLGMAVAGFIGFSLAATAGAL